MQKILQLTLGGTVAMLFAAALFPSANAQLFPYSESTTVATSSLPTITTTTSTVAAMTTSSNSNTPSSSLPSPMPTAPGFIQFNNLNVITVSPVDDPADILADNPVSCEEFATVDSPPSSGIPTPCPVFEGSSTYSIQVGDVTQLLLADRTPATLDNITASDTINAFGYYDGLGNVQASVVRDLSKPYGATPSTAAPTVTQLEAQITEIQSAISQILNEISLLMATPPNNASSAASGPMIPYSPSSTITIATSTSAATGSIIY